MTSFIFCKNCNKLVEYAPITKEEGNTTYTEFKCPNCGFIKKDTRSHIHYGNDAIKK